MPSLAQLTAEQWWSREIVTPELDWLGDEICRRTGRPRVAAGSKGDEHHLRGAHRSQEWILNSRYCTNRSYTVQSGLTATQTRHIAGFDFSPGSTAAMRAQTQRLIDAMRAGRLDEVREVYGTVDGKTVTGWNNQENRYATSDSSHLWHWHISIDRRRLTDRALMERILAIALGEDVDDVSAADVWTYRSTTPETGVTAPAEAYLRVADVIRKKDIPRIEATLATIGANVEALAGRDWVDEQAIIDGVLAGLGSKNLDDVAAALRAALGDGRAAELGALLVATGGTTGTGSA